MAKENPKLDLLDRRLLREHDRDSRQSFVSLSQKLKLSEEALRYRTNALFERKIILNYFTVIDVGKLGNSYYKVFLKVHNTDEEGVASIINHLVRHEAVNWVTRIEGPYHIGFTIRVRQVSDLSAFVDELRRAFRWYIHSLTFAINMQVEFFVRDYLTKSSRREKGAVYTTPGLRYQTDERDLAILRLLATESRRPATEIARELNITSETVGQRIRNLERQRVITGYRLVLNHTAAGVLNWYVLVYVNNISEDRIKAFIDYCRTCPTIAYFIKALGEWDYEMSVEVESIAEYRALMMDLTKRFSGVVRDYLGMVVTDIYKLTLAP